MDVALELADHFVLDKVYAYLVPATVDSDYTYSALSNSTSPPVEAVSAWPRDSILRQCVSILTITQVGACALYFICAALSYYLIFDRRLEYHPRFLKNQVRQEIVSSMTAVPFINLLTLPVFLAEVRGKSLLYNSVDEYGWSWMVISTVLFMIWNDILIYWIHRLEHHPSVYKFIHKPHHKWIGMLFLIFKALHVWFTANTSTQCQHHGPLWLFTHLMDMFSLCHTSKLTRSNTSLQSNTPQHLCLCLPNSKVPLPSSLRTGTDLDYSHPRRGHDFWSLARKVHQQPCPPHSAPHVLYRQLRSVLYLGRHLL